MTKKDGLWTYEEKRAFRYLLIAMILLSLALAL
jgi:hypothetical protein